jgi:hypothetical protein
MQGNPRKTKRDGWWQLLPNCGILRDIIDAFWLDGWQVPYRQVHASCAAADAQALQTLSTNGAATP